LRTGGEEKIVHAAGAAPDWTSLFPIEWDQQEFSSPS
jgi:hypothetical protein